MRQFNDRERRSSQPRRAGMAALLIVTTWVVAGCSGAEADSNEIYVDPSGSPLNPASEVPLALRSGAVVVLPGGLSTDIQRTDVPIRVAFESYRCNESFEGMGRAPTGVVVTRVVDGSPSQGYLRPGDLLLSIDGRVPDGPAAAIDIVQALKPSSSIELEIQRGATKEQLQVRVGSNPQVAGAGYLGAALEEVPASDGSPADLVARPGDELCLLEVRATNLSATEYNRFDASGRMWGLYTSSGTRYVASNLLWEPQMVATAQGKKSARDLGPGESGYEYIFFDMPRGVEPELVTFFYGARD